MGHQLPILTESQYINRMFTKVEPGPSGAYYVFIIENTQDQVPFRPFFTVVVCNKVVFPSNVIYRRLNKHKRFFSTDSFQRLEEYEIYDMIKSINVKCESQLFDKNDYSIM